MIQKVMENMEHPESTLREVSRIHPNRYCDNCGSNIRNPNCELCRRPFSFFETKFDPLMRRRRKINRRNKLNALRNIPRRREKMKNRKCVCNCESVLGFILCLGLGFIILFLTPLWI